MYHLRTATLCQLDESSMTNIVVTLSNVCQSVVCALGVEMKPFCGSNHKVGDYMSMLIWLIMGDFLGMKFREGNVEL